MGLDRIIGSPLVGDRVERDVALVRLLVGDPAAVGRPPEPGRPVHLLLGDELGQAVGEAVGRAFGQATLGLGGDVEDVQVPLADEGDLRPVRRRLRVDLGGLRLGQALQGGVAAEQIEVAADRDDRHVAPIPPGRSWAIPVLPEPLPLAAEGLFGRDVRLGRPGAGGTGDHAAGRAVEGGPPEDAREAVRFGEQVGHRPAVVPVGDRAGDDRAGVGESGDRPGIDRLPGRLGPGRLGHDR